MVIKEPVIIPALGLKAFHEEIYNGNEKMKIVGIRETEVELEGDFSGGIHNIIQKSWLPIKGLFRLRKVCEHHEKNGTGTCPLPNVHCTYPQCEPYV